MFNFNKKIAATRIAVVAGKASILAGKAGDISQMQLNNEFHEARRESNSKIDRAMNGFCVPGGVACTALCRGVQVGTWALSRGIMKMNDADRGDVVKD